MNETWRPVAGGIEVREKLGVIVATVDARRLTIDQRGCISIGCKPHLSARASETVRYRLPNAGAVSENQPRRRRHARRVDARCRWLADPRRHREPVVDREASERRFVL